MAKIFKVTGIIFLNRRCGNSQSVRINPFHEGLVIYNKISVAAYIFKITYSSSINFVIFKSLSDTLNFLTGFSKMLYKINISCLRS